MCGIFGCIGDISREKAFQCIQRISHRGPDATELRALEGVTLAHARLSIIDLSDSANQPMQSLDGRYWILYNGEVYNYVELKKELELKGYQFKTKSDTEILLYSYLEWGIEFQNKCNGMWALAIWDSLKGEMFFSRDRYGIKPLYYYHEGHNLYFASEIKAFFPIMKHRRPNYEVFDKKDWFSYEATDKCVIEGVKRFPPGCYGIYRKESMDIHKWWNTLEHLIKVPKSYKEQVEYLRELFIDSCRIRMRSDVPVGTALSGGVDSGSVAGVMKYLSEHNMVNMKDHQQHVFVAAMEGSKYDETVDASIAAEYIGVHINKVKTHPNISPERLLHYIYMCEDPYVASPVVFMQTYEAIRNSGIKVSIDGHGADELFAGYANDIIYAINDCKSYHEKRRLCETYNQMVPKESRLDINTLVELARTREIEGIAHNDKQWKAKSELNKRLYYQAHYGTLPTIIRNFDRYGMANSLEIRMPFMDYRIVTFAFSIPWTSKVRGGYSKAIVRDMAGPFMSHHILKKKMKIGFNSPLEKWFNGELKEFLLDMVHSKDFFECDLINPLEIMTDVGEFYAEGKNDLGAASNIWVQIIPYLWEKAMIHGGYE